MKLDINETNKTEFRLVLLLNLIIGIYNVGLYALNDSHISLIIGALNIGVWVFFREYLNNK